MSRALRGPAAERRRRHASPFVSLHGLRGRRRRFRRAEDKLNPDLALDWHAPQLLGIVLGIMLLCLADAHNTLQLMQLGARELNLLMDYLIRQGVAPFVQVKLGLTALCLMLLVAHQHVALFKRFKVRHLLYIVFAFYTILIGYELMIWPGPGIPFIFIPV